jgi:thioredoxin reductase
MVIGDANSALQYAILLASQCPHVDVVTLFDKFFADDISSKASNPSRTSDLPQPVLPSFNGDGKEPHVRSASSTP